MSQQPAVSPPTTPSTSTELTGGAGYTYEDTVVAYYLAALLRQEAAAGQPGVVVRVAVQQWPQGHPLDDLTVLFRDAAGDHLLDLQIKRSLTISAAASNEDFREILSGCRETRAKPGFRPNVDRYGFVAETVAVEALRSFRRLLEWSRSSTTQSEFASRFEGNGAAAQPERRLRAALRPLVATTDDAEVDFYRHLVVPDLAGLEMDGALAASICNCLQHTLAPSSGVTGAALFAALCREARQGAGTGKVWTRPTLLRELAPAFRLRGIPSFADDLAIIRSLADTAIADISDQVGNLHIHRKAKLNDVLGQLANKRFVNITGLPGSGKSAVLRNVAQALRERGPLLFLKCDLLQGTDWQSFAVSRGLRHTNPVELLSEIGSTGNAVLLIDGIDRIAPPQRRIVKDLLGAMTHEPALANWKVLVTSRDQGLEPFRAWVPTTFYAATGIGDVTVGQFSDAEAETLAEHLPCMRGLLFGPQPVREIARRPFFAAVLAGNAGQDVGQADAQTETDLIAYWWGGGGYGAEAAIIPQRQRALLDLANTGARSLGNAVHALQLAADTVARLAELVDDGIIRTADQGATYSFTHDIFFEWAYLRLLIGRGHEWTTAIVNAGEPPLLGRVVSLFAQLAITSGNAWEDGWSALNRAGLRPQWRRAWLIGPPARTDFAAYKARFQALLAKDDYALLRRFLVWFQAEQTMPSPVVLQHPDASMDGAARLRAADVLGWPTDFATWQRVLSWLLSNLDGLPVAMRPHVVELFQVWQNALGSMPNDLSDAILKQCEAWLLNIESFEYRERLSFDHGEWGEFDSDTRASFESALRQIILGSSRGDPNYANRLLDRTIANRRLRDKTYTEVVAFAPLLSTVAPQKLADLARAQLIKLLPEQEIEQDRKQQQRHRDMLARIRAKSESERTDQENRILEHAAASIVLGAKEYDLDDIGIDQHASGYFPSSPLHQPFASLFAAHPAIGLALVRDLANHATEGWRQIHALYPRRSGTPIPVDLDFPWGTQRFWGEWRTYNWIKGHLAPNPLACAFLGLAYWAHKQLDAGRPVDGVIREVVEGHQSWTVLCLAASLALETHHVSATVLPIATCQRLWEADLARATQESAPEIDLLGLGRLSRPTGDKAAAVAYLQARKSRSRHVRMLAPFFALSSNEELRAAYAAKLARFPDEPPFDYEEQRRNPELASSLKETAQQWSGLGDAANYKARDAGDNKHVLIEFESPRPLTQQAAQHLETNAIAIREYAIAGWASRSLHEGAVASTYTLQEATAFAHERDSPDLFRTLTPAGGGMTQSAVAGIAACVIGFGTTQQDIEWAWKVMARVQRMREQRDPIGSSNMPWHPVHHLIFVLNRDLQGQSPRQDAASRLLGLAVHPNDGVARAALTTLVNNQNIALAWNAAKFASDLFIYRRPAIADDGTRDDSANEAARRDALARARRRLKTKRPAILTAPPPAWRTAFRQSDELQDTLDWRRLDIRFEPHVAEQIIGSFPVETICRSDQHRKLFLTYLRQLVEWTHSRFNPGPKPRDRRRSREYVDLHLWPNRLGDLLARAAPYLSFHEFRTSYLGPFLDPNDENSLSIMSEFAHATVCRHVLDAESITPRTLQALDHCVDQLSANRIFHRDGYRSGEIPGFYMPRLIKALLMVPLDEPAPGARRFANGIWTDLPDVMPIVTKVVHATGWAPFVMDTFLSLCERADLAYPIDLFASQAKRVLDDLGENAWIGTLLPARIAAVVQNMADGHFPLPSARATALLQILDALIDLGDRRSAALQRSDAFRATQTRQN